MKVTRDKLLLVIVAKAPIPGSVKTRLCSKLTPQEASELYCCFLEDKTREMSFHQTLPRQIASQKLYLFNWYCLRYFIISYYFDCPLK